MAWTQQIPTHEGYYWFDGEGPNTIPGLVLLVKLIRWYKSEPHIICWGSNIFIPLERFTGQWDGPLEIPPQAHT